MEPWEIEKFRIIGAYTVMQKISLEEEFRLIDGIAYDIDIYQDFSTTFWEGKLLNDLPVADIMNAILQSEETYSHGNYSREDWQKSQKIWDLIDESIKKEQRAQKKWEKRDRKPQNQKEAVENFKRAVKHFK